MRLARLLELVVRPLLAEDRACREREPEVEREPAAVAHEPLPVAARQVHGLAREHDDLAAEEERRAVAARTRLMPVAGPIRQADVMPFGHEGKAGVDCRLLDESACSGAMHVRKQLRGMGMCGSMLGPGPFSLPEHLEGWAAGRLRRWSL